MSASASTSVVRTTPYGRVVLVGGILVLLAAAVGLVATGNTEIRYSADHETTKPMWLRWIPAGVGILLIRLLPMRLDRAAGGPAAGRQAWVLLGLGVAFAVLLKLTGQFEMLKAVLLLILPLVLLRWYGGKPTANWPATVRWEPVIPVVAWLMFSYVGPLAPEGRRPDLPALELAVAVLVGFLVNSVLEEYFYRRWLQTRWEQLLGPWPAILIASIVWAVWHVSIQGTGTFGVDLAATLVNQGVLGLYLGYLWSRYRRMWPLLTVHGATNVVPILLSLG